MSHSEIPLRLLHTSYLFPNRVVSAKVLPSCLSATIHIHTYTQAHTLEHSRTIQIKCAVNHLHRGLLNQLFELYVRRLLCRYN